MSTVAKPITYRFNVGDIVFGAFGYGTIQQHTTEIHIGSLSGEACARVVQLVEEEMQEHEA